MEAVLMTGSEAELLRRSLLISAGGHAVLLTVALLNAVLSGKPVLWGEGGSGGGVNVRLVSAASVPLPPPAVPTKNRVANEDPGLHYPEPAKAVPKPAKETPEPKAVELPGRKARTVPQPKAAPPRQEARVRTPEPPPAPSNEIPYGRGGPAQGPYGMLQSDVGSGGLRFEGGAGDFGTRYSWYVTAIRNRISGNWLQGTIDPNIHSAPRVYVAFRILRDGRIVNTQLTASSGIPSLDRSAVRAILDSNPMPSLPGDYPGSSVAVEFWFDFRR